MTAAEAEKRIARSRTIVSRYKAMGRPHVGDLAQLISMFRDEIVIVEKIAAEHPHTEPVVTELVRQCQAYMLKLKLGAN